MSNYTHNMILPSVYKLLWRCSQHFICITNVPLFLGTLTCYDFSQFCMHYKWIPMGKLFI